MNIPPRLRARALALRVLAIATIALVATGRLAAAELPTFKQGLWEFTSTTLVQGSTQPHVRTAKACTSPSEDIRKKWERLAAQTCKFSPVRRNGTRYSYSSSCQKNGVSLRTTSMISAESDSSYRVDTNSRSNGAAEKEILIARRVGDCVAGQTQGTSQPPSATMRVPESSAKRTM